MRVRLAEIKKEKEDLKASETSVQTPKSGKHGVINTCPNCGATVEAGSVKCTECGYIFTGVGANSSAAELDRRLRNVTGTNSDSDKKRANIISSFPIPNAREDLFEFLAALEPKALVNNTSKKQEEQKITKAYLEKFLECLNKARIGFGNDSATMMFIEHYNAFQSKKKKKLYLMIVAAICIVVVAAIGIFKYVQDANALQAEYVSLKESSMSEIGAYAAELDAKLDEIPIPTAANVAKCANMWSKISWSKSWPVPKHLRDYATTEEKIDGFDGANFEAFVEKKNQIGRQIGNIDGNYYYESTYR